MSLACFEPQSEEDRVRATLAEVAAEAAKPDLGGVIAPFADDYKDAEGTTRDQIKGFLFREFRVRGPVRSVLSPITVQLSDGGRRARATFEAVLAVGISLDAPIPESADAYRFVVDLELRDGDWKIVSHERSSARGVEIQIAE